jgi:hypothetical protein
LLITKTGLNLFRLYSDADGQTHLEDVGYSMATTKHGLIAENVFADEMGVRVWDGGSEAAEFTTSPARQLYITLGGKAEVEASDGSRRTLEVGTILLTEDTTGIGHRVHEIEQPRLVLLVPLANKKRAPTGLLW